MKKRIIATIVFIAATIAAIIAAYALGMSPPVTYVAGAFAAAAVLIVVSKLIKVDDSIFISALIFVFLASPMGSILDLYRSFYPYDKIVHFISGILLAVFGMVIVRSLIFKSAAMLNRNCSQEEILAAFAVPMIFAACMFSSGAAGLWEIFELIADRLAGGAMQRGMVDTVTDMIAGNIGALTYGIWAFVTKSHTKKFH